jgi:hypothetical protein
MFRNTRECLKRFGIIKNRNTGARKQAAGAVLSDTNGRGGMLKLEVRHANNKTIPVPSML